MKRLKYVIASLAALTMFLVPAQVGAQGLTTDSIKGRVCGGTELSGSATGTAVGDCSDSSFNLEGVARTVVNVFTWIVGVVAVIMIIYAGFRYITSGGDSKKVGDAKNAIIFALIGLVIVILAQVIINFVVTEVTASTT